MSGHLFLLTAVKTVPTLAWFTIEACMVYVLYAGVRGRTDRKVGLAAGVVTAGTLVFAANGFHCPLTAIHVPLILLAVFLHWRNHRSKTEVAGHGA